MLTGDFHRLQELRQSLQQLAGGQALSSCLTRAATARQGQVIDGFKESRDPYGRTWKPRKNGGSWPILRKTDRMLFSFRTRPIPRGLRITAVDYAGFHQSGTQHMIARKVVPDPEMGLGKRWGEALAQVAADALRSLAGGV